MPDIHTRTNAESLSEQAQELVSSAGLPVEDVNDVQWFKVIEYYDAKGGLLAVGGLERCDSALLLRSVAVTDSHRKKGIGSDLVSELLRHAQKAGYHELYLLTLDAQDYFNRFGFAEIIRKNAPEAIRHSSQFTGTCPQDATLMIKTLCTPGNFY